MQRLLSEWVLKLSEVCPRIEIDLAIELFIIETLNFQEHNEFIFYFIKCLKSRKILDNLVMREKTSLGRI